MRQTYWYISNTISSLERDNILKLSCVFPLDNTYKPLYFPLILVYVDMVD